MTPARARELLGGLAAGILSTEERQTLFEAALHDQTLFNEVADELEFAAFLQSPDTRAQLANRIEVEPRPRRWWALRPAWLALSGVLAASTVLFVAVWHRTGEVEQMSAPAPPSAARAVAPADQPPAPLAAQKKTGPTRATAAPRAAAKGSPGTPKVAEPEQTLAKKQEAASEEKELANPRRDGISANKPKMALEQPTRQQAGGGGSSGDARLPADQNAVPLPPTPAPQNAFAPKAAPAPETVRPAQEAGMRGAETPKAAPSPPPPPPQAAAPTGAFAGIATGRAGAIVSMPGSVEGTVHDAAGAVIPNARIDIVNKTTGTTRHTVSDQSGRFVAAELATGGPYTVIATAPGFKREERSGIVLAANQPARVDIPLNIGNVSESVEITASAASVGPNERAKSQIAVFDFLNDTAQSQSGRQAADLLSNQLLDSGQVGVIDRDKVQQAQRALSQSRFKAKTSRPPSTKDVADLGRRIGADAVIVGTVQPGAVAGSKDSNVAMTAQVIDTRKRRQLSQASANGASLKGATNALGLKLQSQLVPVEGAVTAADSGLVSVTFKAPGEPRIGARFDVYRGTRKIGELTLTSAYGQSAAGKFSGATQPRPGDRVTPKL